MGRWKDEESLVCGPGSELRLGSRWTSVLTFQPVKTSRSTGRLLLIPLFFFFGVCATLECLGVCATLVLTPLKSKARTRSQISNISWCKYRYAKEYGRITSFFFWSSGIYFVCSFLESRFVPGTPSTKWKLIQNDARRKAT